MKPEISLSKKSVYTFVDTLVLRCKLINYLTGDVGGSGVAIKLYLDLTGLSKVEEAAGRANCF